VKSNYHARQIRQAGKILFPILIRSYKAIKVVTATPAIRARFDNSQKLATLGAY
jgi:hypothetical protein